MDAAGEREFGDYVVARSGALCRFAYLLCGDWHRAEDAVQATLAKLYLRWGRLDDTGRVDPYVRRVLVTSIIDDGRRGWFRREVVSAAPPDAVHVEDLAEASALRLAVLAALAEIPPRQRAVLVLRYWEDQSLEQVAQILDCSVGTVKSQAAHGLSKLRRLLSDHVTLRAEESV